MAKKTVKKASKPVKKGMPMAEISSEVKKIMSDRQKSISIPETPLTITPIVSKNYKCTGVVFGSKGTKIAKFIEKVDDSYRKDHHIELFFASDEECAIVRDEVVNVTISKV